MINRLGKGIYALYLVIKGMFFTRRHNLFVDALYHECLVSQKRFDVLAKVLLKYGTKLDCIDDQLYKYLNNEDRNTLVRWFLKRRYGLQTATKEEIAVIDSAFKTVENIYSQNDKNEYLSFNFRGKNIKFLNTPYENDSQSSVDENRLMHFYAVTHAFFLTEYEMDGFNPKNGLSILDCGAALGDTLLLFKALYPDSVVYSFEYLRENVDIIKQNATINDLSDYTVVNTFLYKDSIEHRINPNSFEIEDGLVGEVVKTTSIDDFVALNNINDIGLIKFDIEGGEQNALRGAFNTIRQQRPLLYIPIYHLESDIFEIPRILYELNMKMQMKIKWTEKKVWGMDCVLFVKFI